MSASSASSALLPRDPVLFKILNLDKGLGQECKSRVVALLAPILGPSIRLPKAKSVELRIGNLASTHFFPLEHVVAGARGERGRAGAGRGGLGGAAAAAVVAFGPRAHFQEAWHHGNLHRVL